MQALFQRSPFYVIIKYKENGPANPYGMGKRSCDILIMRGNGRCKHGKSFRPPVKAAKNVAYGPLAIKLFLERGVLPPRLCL
jgi:hypothetical protein